MKKSLILLFLSIVTAAGFAQSFSVSQSSAVVNGSYSANEFYTDIKVYNNTASNLMVRWVRTQQIMPPTWRTSVCNDYYCFGMYTDSAAFTMLPGDSDMVQMHFYPANTPGSATIPVKIYAVNDPSDSLVITFYGNAPVGINENTEIRFNTYPNPVTDKLDIMFSAPAENIEVEIYDMLGRQMSSAGYREVQKRVQLNVASLPSGYYFVKIAGADGAVTVRKFMKH